METHDVESNRCGPNQLASEQAGRRFSMGKFRLDRGPLRWWLIVGGTLAVQFFPWHFALGSALVLSGAILHLLSKGYLRQSRKFLRRTQALTTRGPYRFTRNPFYLGNLLAESGLLVIIGQPYITLAYFTVWAWVYRKTILREEAELLQLCGASYETYRCQVPRLFPVPWKYLPKAESTGPRFSWINPNIAGGCEVERVIRLLSYPVLLLAASFAKDRERWSDLRLAWPAIDCAAVFLLLNVFGMLTTPLLNLLKTSESGQCARHDGCPKMPIP